jgi:hypothetical protein
MRARRLIVSGADRAPQRRADTEYVKVIARHDAASHQFCTFVRAQTRRTAVFARTGMEKLKTPMNIGRNLEMVFSFERKPL